MSSEGDFLYQLTPEAERLRKKRNLTIMLGLLAFTLLVFAVTMVKFHLKTQMEQRAQQKEIIAPDVSD